MSRLPALVMLIGFGLLALLAASTLALEDDSPRPMPRPAHPG